MTTGKTEYSPDYESEKHPHRLASISGILESHPLRDEYLNALATSETDIERTRLERIVIEAVKEWRKEKVRICHTTYTPEQRESLYHEVDMRLAVKVDALESFEAKQKNG